MSAGESEFRPVDVPHVSTRHRKIQTPIPVPESRQIFEGLAKYESRSMHGQLPAVWDRAEGFQVFDPWGNCWIDFTSTIFVANSGHANPEIIKALRGALDRKLLHTYNFAHPLRLEFLRELCEMSPEPLKKAFLLSAGTEATEAAVKLMRLNGMKRSADKRVIVSFLGCMHGRTMCAEMLKGPKAATASWVGHRGNEIFQLPFPYPWECDESGGARRFERDMEALLLEQGIGAEKIAGFIIEPYQGWGAVFYPQSYIKALSSFAMRHGALICFDEIQSGFGRTGKLYAFEHYGVQADLLCLGKGLTSSLPMSAVIGRPEVMDLPAVGEMSSTHSGNPMCCAAGLANIRSIKDRTLVAESERKGRTLRERLLRLRDRHPEHVRYIAARGLVAAVITSDPATGGPDGPLATDAVMRAFRKGLLTVHTGRESIKIGPPLVITDEALNEGLDVLDESFDEAVAARDRKGG